MTFIYATLLFLFLVIASISAIRIIRTALSWNRRLVLLATRFLLLALIAIAFIEPVMVFDQLQAKHGSVPVLIDASKSMRLFLQDSAINRGISQIEAWNTAHAGKNQKFVFYAFGDSLVSLKHGVRSMQWSDRHSFLPESIKDPFLRHSNTLLLVSDGNWSNASVPTAFFSDKNVFYLPLKGTEKQPYLQITLPGFPAVSAIDSPLVASIVVEGVSGLDNNVITLSLMESNKELDQKKIPVARGFFKNDVRISLKNAVPGRHLYRFEAHSVHDSMSSFCYALHSKLPKRFYYAIYNTHPTLDGRFIQMSLKRQRFFVESGTDKTHNPDLLVLFDWDQNAMKLFNALKPGGAALFIGTLPCTTAPVRSAVRSQLLRPPRGTVSNNPFDVFDYGKLPPPSSISFCKSLPVLPQNVFLIAAMHDQPVPDTLNLLFTGRLDNRNYIACAARDIWRWDFLPLAIGPDENLPFNFSGQLIAFSKEMLVNALSEELFLFPETALTESDSLALLVVLPVGLPVPADIKVSCKFTSVKNGVFDTAFVLKSTGTSKEKVRFRPLPLGAYRFEATASANNRRYQFVDSVFIQEDRSEYTVNGQNTALLQEVAQPIPDFSESSLKSLFFSSASEINQQVRKTVHLNRSWPLLLLIFGVFAGEWILRRVLKLD